ncbi:MAG: hypothetical protein HOV80_30650 [Polyangiaceae bacterium]|nr:hypothetical protein [Polyangiaceae bacterium]
MKAQRMPRILGVGAMTVAGYDATSSAFVARSGGVDTEELGPVDQEQRPIHGRRVAALSRDLAGIDRLVALAAGALVEAAASFPGQRIPLFLALAEPTRPDAASIDDGAMIERLAAASGVPLDRAMSRVVRVGRAGGAWALEAALAQARAGMYALAGGIDSLIGPATLSFLDGEERLATLDRDGVSPSEASAFILVGPSDAADRTALCDARYLYQAEARAEARALLAASSASGPTWLLADLDGLPERAVELADDLIVTRMTETAVRDELSFLYGEVGAAAFPLLAVHADVACRLGFAPAKRAIVRAGGLTGEGLGIAVLESGADHA